MWYVIGLIWLALIVGIIWAYRKKRERHAAARTRKLDALLSEFKLDAGSAPGAAAGIATQAVAARRDPNPVPEFGKKQRLLPQAEALLYYVFRTGLPDHEIFANLTLADVVELDPSIRGYEREQRLRRLTQQRLDLVICTKQLEVVAAAMVDKGAAPDGAGDPHARFADECLKAAGIRLIRIDPAAPPMHHHVRDLVYGTGG